MVAVWSALLALALDADAALDFSVGPKEIIYSKSQRSKKKLASWPDGNLGVIALGDGMYDFYGANGRSPVKTTGSLTNPGQSKKSVSITGIPKKAFDYLAGGPVYQDPVSGARLMIYHAEQHGKSSKDFHSMLGMAVSTDVSGLRFRDLGIIVEPNLSQGFAEVGGGTFAVVGDYFHVYYRDWLDDGSVSQLAVARAPLADLISNALGERGTPFSKYYDGDWTQPGRGGLASALEIGNPSNDWVSVSQNDYLGQLLMVSSQWSPEKQDLYLSTSQDGIHWSPRQALVTDPGEQFYPTLIGTGADPTRTDQSFYVYYTDSKKGAWNRWKDAQLVRREIVLNPSSPLASPLDPTVPSDPLGPLVPSPIPDPQPTDWISVASYASDFQTEGPADGWQYVWNPSGKLDNPSAFARLAWSDSAQAYNTTGAATPTPGSKSHSDDYLTLTADGGHPGRPNFAAIAGYTIQEEDGAGLYRVFDSTIQKADGKKSSGEDGLQVFVYVNDTQIGPAEGVSTNGLLASFDRELGQLNVGDTIWVAVDALKNQSYDAFIGFDFAIQRSMPASLVSNLSTHSMQLFSAIAIPEPDAVILAMVAMAFGCFVRVPARIRL